MDFLVDGKNYGYLGASNQQDHVKSAENEEKMVIFAQKHHF